MIFQHSAKTITDIDRDRNKDIYMLVEGIWNKSKSHLSIICNGTDLSTAQFICETIITTFYSNESSKKIKLLKKGIEKANLDLLNSQDRNRGQVIVALIHKNKLQVLHVSYSGTFKVSHISGNQISHELGRIDLITKLIEEGQLTLEEAKNTPYVVPAGTLSLGYEEEIQIEEFSKSISEGDIILLSTISSWEHLVLSNDLVQLLRNNSLKEASNYILSLNENNQHSADDTLVIVSIEEMEKI